MTEQTNSERTPEAEAAHKLAEQILALAVPDGVPNHTGVVVAALTRVTATVWAHVALQHNGTPDAAACMAYRHANSVADAAAQMLASHFQAQQEALHEGETLQ